jgi:hypothetical protein
VDDPPNGASIAGINALGIDIIGVGETSPADGSIALSPQDWVIASLRDAMPRAQVPINVVLAARYRLLLVARGDVEAIGSTPGSRQSLTCYSGRRR